MHLRNPRSRAGQYGIVVSEVCILKREVCLLTSTFQGAGGRLLHIGDGNWV